MTATKEPAKFRALLHQPAPKSMMDTHTDTRTQVFEGSFFYEGSSWQSVWCTYKLVPTETGLNMSYLSTWATLPTYTPSLPTATFFSSIHWCACVCVCVCSEPTSSSGSGLRSHCLPSLRLTSHSFTHKYCDRCPPAPREAYAGLLYTIVHATPPVKLRQVESRILLCSNPCDLQWTPTPLRHSHRTYLHQNGGFIENNTVAFAFLFFIYIYIYWLPVMQMAWFVFRWRILLTVGINNHRKMKG